MRTQLLRMLPGAALILFGASAVVASPSMVDDNRRITVSYADLDLDSEAGAKVLYGRLKRAAKQVCGLRSYSEVGLTVYMQSKTCYRETLAKAVDDVGSDVLDTIHSG